MFKNFKVTDAEVAARLAELKAGFAASGKPGTFVENAIRVIGNRMRAHPERYVEFGPYWWAVKRILNGGGWDFGQQGESMLADEYRASGVAQTLVAAELFKDYYRATFIVGTASFDLEDEGVLYQLSDPDMQARVGKPA